MTSGWRTVQVMVIVCCGMSFFSVMGSGTQISQDYGVVKEKDSMGSWETGIFQNDIALDFLTELNAGDVEALLTSALALPDNGYIEEDTGIRALVAAAIVAACKDANLDHLPESSRHIVGRSRKPSVRFIALAEAAAKKVLLSSETRELREELGQAEFKAWQAEVEDLIHRLNGRTSP